eukprot:sb/3479735/
MTTAPPPAGITLRNRSPRPPSFPPSRSPDHPRKPPGLLLRSQSEIVLERRQASSTGLATRRPGSLVFGDEGRSPRSYEGKRGWPPQVGDVVMGMINADRRRSFSVRSESFEMNDPKNGPLAWKQRAERAGKAR